LVQDLTKAGIKLSNMQEIKNHDELKALIKQHKFVYCLLYKSDSEVSACALDKIQSVKIESKDSMLCKVDVSHVKDIHPEYYVTSAPTLLVFENQVQTNQVKGCNDVSFYENLIAGKYFVPTESTTSKQAPVTVYTTPTCTYCNSLKSYLRKHQIHFREVDISKSQTQAEQLVKRTGQQGVPQTDINGTFVIGFDTNKINRLLNIQS
jgi:glutaredoxin-like YruB-family protein